MAWRGTFRVVVGLALALSSVRLGAAPQADSVGKNEQAFLMVAPDRGFLGNEETRDAYEAFAGGRNAALVFVTDERTGASLDGALRGVIDKGARHLAILPFFLSRADPRFVRVQSLLAERSAKVQMGWARPFGESYFAVEELAERMRAIREAGKTRVIVVGAGAREEAAGRRMLPDWERLAKAASAGLGFESVHTVLEASPARLGPALGDAARGAERAVVLPFHLGSKLDGMMSYSASVRAAAPEGAEVVEGDVTPDASVALWLNREANRQTPLHPQDVGVVILAHGADYHWNETMREAVASLAARYKIEPAFSMADPVVIERAVRRLEARGARFIVILRVFGLTASFQPTVERLIGLDIERDIESGRTTPDPPAGHGMGHDHGHSRPPARIRSASVLATLGGVEDDPLFAEALLARALVLSRNPARETVILVAHGDGDDARDTRWRELLASLAKQMQQKGGGCFRAIRTATWREDWPEKRKAAVEQVRSFVQDASADGGRALVIPARILGQGPERNLLEGLSFELGEGFAPLPLFARWVEKQVAAAVAEEQRSREVAAGAVASTRHASANAGTEQ